MKNLFFVLLSLLTISANAQPVNDNCSGAITVTVAANQASSAPIAVSTFSATNSGVSPDCSQFMSSSIKDVWYQFTAPSAHIAMTFSNKSLNNKIGFALYTNTCSSLLDAYCGNDSAKFNGLTVGQTYFLQLYYNGANLVGTFDFSIFSFVNNATAQNDECINATPITIYSNTATCIPTTINMSGSSLSGFYGSCTSMVGVNPGDVWIKFTATSNTANFVFSNGTGQAASAIRYQIYTQPCSLFTTNVAQQSVCAYLSSSMYGQLDVAAASISLTVGQTYYAKIYPATNITGGTIDFCIVSNGSQNGIIKERAFSRLPMMPNPTNGDFEFALPYGKNIKSAWLQSSLGTRISLPSTTVQQLQGFLSQGLYHLFVEDEQGNIYTEKVCVY
ncbi:MAG: hypothetical protein J0M08_00135 [Bacteroidetes bacterium]|nr:hypothetical protein [Bacteroidota bacterium]